jgi:hypothetical protein
MEICINDMHAVVQMEEAFKAGDLHCLRAVAAAVPCERRHELPWFMHLDVEHPMWATMMHAHMRHPEAVDGFGDGTFLAEGTTAFQWACRQGYLDTAQWLLASPQAYVDPHNFHDFAFRGACEHGHLAVAQWLVGLQGVDVHGFGEAAFRAACRNGHLAVARWLVSLGAVDVHAEDEEAFTGAVYHDHLEVAQWLCSLGVVVATSTLVKLAQQAIHSNHRGMLQWLLQRPCMNVHLYGDLLFQTATAWGESSHNAIACWLLDQDPSWTQWPVHAMRNLQWWSEPRDAWMRAVVAAAAGAR